MVIPASWGDGKRRFGGNTYCLVGSKDWRICVGMVEGKGPWIGRYTCCLRMEGVRRVDSLRGWWKVVQRQNVKV